MSTRIEPPEDVLSDDEPVFQDDQTKWVGVRVDRTEFPEADTAQYFGEYYTRKVKGVIL